MTTFYASYPVVGSGGGGGSGTVTSVGLLDGSSTPIYSISGGPVTTSGTLEFTLETQSANEVFAGPTTGSAAQPGFRTLVTADLPSNFGTPGTLVGTNISGTGANFTAGNSSKVGGITVTGTPSSGQVLTATSTSAANWQAGGGGSATPPTQQIFTSGSGTYTTPVGAVWIRVKMAGGGGGGGGGGATSSSNGTAGGNTTFGTSLLVANGGAFGQGPNTSGVGLGGTASLGSGPTGVAFTGQSGGGVTLAATIATVTYFPNGGYGGSTFFGGGGSARSADDGQAAIANTGSGGAGGSADNNGTNGNSGGTGGGSGGYLEALISGGTLASTFAYNVGSAGTGGNGTDNNGGNGAIGIIIVEEHYGS